jgi:2-oxoisovalerate dehydrogenase E1 component
VVILEPTALYAVRDLHQPGDGEWQACLSEEVARVGQPRVYGDAAADAVIATYGRGTWLSLRAARRLAERAGLRVRVIDLRWLAPLPTGEVIEHARETGRLLVVDDCRRSGGIAEALAAAILETRQPIEFARLSSADCYVPIGRAAKTVLVSEEAIEHALLHMCGTRG